MIKNQLEGYLNLEKKNRMKRCIYMPTYMDHETRYGTISLYKFKSEIQLVFWEACLYSHVLALFKQDFRENIQKIMEEILMAVSCVMIGEKVKAYMITYQSLELSCATNNCCHLLQVFADNYFKKELEQWIFELVV